MKHVLSVAFLFLNISFCFSQIYVVPGGTGDGSSWANAAGIEDAITTAPNNTELRLRGGIYNITATLAVTHRLTINGGYTGAGTTRNPVTNPSVLDGGGATQIILIDEDNVVIDGLEFRRGFVTGGSGGGAIYITGRVIRIANSKFLDNISSGERGGGAIYIGSSARDVVISDCLFENNRNNFV